MPTEFDHVAMLSLLRDGYNDNNDPFTLRRRALDAAIAALQAQQPGAQAIVIPEPSEADVELAWSTLRSTTQPRDSCACDGDMRAALTTYTARLRERIGQAPWGDGDA